MPHVFARISSAVSRLLDGLHLNFFRIHLLWFTINPLIWSIIFWASNGRFPVSYVDAVFLCVSAQTVTGLSTVNLSSLTPFQQFILFFLMCIGNYTIVSWVMVMIRKQYFVQHILAEQPPATHGTFTRMRSMTMAALASIVPPGYKQVNAPVSPPIADSTDPKVKTSQPVEEKPISVEDKGKYRAQDNAELVASVIESPSAMSSPLPEDEEKQSAKVPSPVLEQVINHTSRQTESPSDIDQRLPLPQSASNRVDFALPLSQTRSGVKDPSPLRQVQNRTGSVRVRTPPGPDRQGTGLFFSTQNPTTAIPRTPTQMGTIDARSSMPPSTSRTQSRDSVPSIQLTQSKSRTPLSSDNATFERGFGGFPTPLTLAERLAKSLAPRQYAELKRKLTLDEENVYLPLEYVEGNQTKPNLSTAVSRTLTRGSTHRRGTLARHESVVPGTAFHIQSIRRPELAPPHLQTAPTPVPEHLRHAATLLQRSSSSSTVNLHQGWMDELNQGMMKAVHYMKGGVLRVGRNSAFNTDDLSDEQLADLGGMEYRALRALSWIVGLYFVGVQLACALIYIIYLYTTKKYDAVFAEQQRTVSKAWFSIFQAVSAYTGGGLTIVDQSMSPFIDAYTLVVFLGWLIVAGSIGLPIFLRLIVWILCKLAPPKQKEPLQFLLDHPRRCFIYMFPAHQTWFLVVVFMTLTCIGWFGFLILDIGLPVVTDIPSNTRVLAGLFQSIAVRSSGFGIVSLNSLAPAVKFLYLIMMYVAAYPVAMSIRSTNVYEQRSLGVYEDIPEDENNPDVDEAAQKIVGPKGEVLFSRYLGMHIRRQLSYDLWWLALALFLICIVERGPIMQSDNDTWFNQFTVMFEIVSAYGTIGLSLGIPTENYSLCGAFQPLSKVVLLFVMLRGRHRDLPQAVDRAILLPHEFNRIRVDPSGSHIVDAADPRPSA